MSNSLIMDREDILNGLEALTMQQNVVNGLMKDEPFAAGYRAGVYATILAVAKLAGVASDIRVQGILPAQIEEASL